MSDAIRWNNWTLVQPVQFDYETRATPRTVRLCCPAARVGDPVRIGMGGAEIDAVITAVTHSVLHVRLRVTRKRRRNELPFPD
jgi:hypothetical protein